MSEEPKYPLDNHLFQGCGQTQYPPPTQHLESVYSSEIRLCHRQCSHPRMRFPVLSTLLLCIWRLLALPVGLNEEKGKGDKEAGFVKMNLYCDMCDSLLPVIKTLVVRNKPGAVDRLVDLLCSTIFRSTFTKNVCMESYKTYKEDVFKILLTSTLASKEMCRNIFFCSKFPYVEWNISIPSHIEKYVTKQDDAKLSNSRPLRILHLTDIHVQLNYQPNSSAACNEPLCCYGPEVDDVSKRAGFYGDYRKCDLPLWTIEQIFSYIKNNEKFDIIYWTGDASSHQLWKHSLDIVMKINQEVLKLLSSHFPDKKIYSSIGNHDIHPCNMFPSSQIANTSAIIYNSLVDEWIRMGGLASECRKTIMRGGFYTTMIGKKLRLISLNTNYGRRENFWLQVNQTDPEGQLKWLVDTLHNAEERGEKVHIISHHFPASSMWSWSANFANIVKRYNRTISCQLYGHDHVDSFTVFTDEKNNSFSTAYLSPSLTSYPNQNPAYVIFTIDPSSGEVIDHRSTIMDLGKSNEEHRLVMRHEHSMKETFDLKDLSPQSLLDIVSKAKQDIYGDVMNTILSKRYKVPGVIRCDAKCRNYVLCTMTNHRSDSNSTCEHSPPIVYIYQNE